MYLIPLLVTLGVFVALWPISLRLRDASVVDIWWGPGFGAQIVLAAWWSGNALGPREWMLVALVCLWSLRLGWVLTARRARAGSEDPRYTVLRDAWHPGFWWKSLFVVFLLQGILQWLIALGPMAGVLAGQNNIGVVAAIGAAIAAAGLGLEALADRQLDKFKRTAEPGALFTGGLRAHLRHPNYLGEVVFWIGVGLIVAEGGLWIAALWSPLLITVLLTRLSGVPMLDERLSATRPGYAAYRRAVPGFIPRFRAWRQRRAA
ncbi:MAG: DUF1295 domain-containing protein [Pseudomonadota bacterium]